MYCNGCKYDLAVGVRIGYDGDVKWEVCDRCSRVTFQADPDIYFKGNGEIQTEESLAGKDGNPIPFSSKREKAAIMKHLGLKQADCAERQHGSRNETKRRTYFT